MLLDTSVLFAAIDRSDHNHAECARLVERERVELPAPVLVELDQLGRSRGLPAGDIALSGIEEGSIHVIDLDRGDYVRVHQLVAQYADLQLGFVEASVIAVAERLEETTIATLDHRHFSAVRPAHVEAFTLVP